MGMPKKRYQYLTLLIGAALMSFVLGSELASQEPAPPPNSGQQRPAPEKQSGTPTDPATDNPGGNKEGTSPDTRAVDKKAGLPDTANYKIGEQDVVNITVWKEPQLSGPVVVRPDGKISVPLIDEVQASGLTPMELQNVLLEKFRPFLAVPKVSVSIREINSRKVYVIGQVNHPGTVHINSNTTVLQALTDAGGLRDYANPKKIYVMRTVNGKPVKYPFHYDAVLKGQHYEENITVQPGDTIVVP
jgi:polysaccharide export outer membrane protein